VAWQEAAEVLEESTSFRARARAAFLLGSSRDPGTVRPLARALQNDPHASVRTAAASALGALGQLAALPALQDARADPARAVRLQVARSLRRIARRTAIRSRSPRPAAQGAAREGQAGAVVATRGSPPASARLSAARGPRHWELVDRVVVVGQVDNRTPVPLADLEDRVRGELTRRLSEVPGTLVFPSRASVSPATAAEVSARGLPRLRIDTRWVEVARERRPGMLSVRCAVTLLLLGDLEETLRGSLEGGMTASLPAGEDRDDDPRVARHLTERALVGAVRAALADAGEALRRAAPGSGER